MDFLFPKVNNNVKIKADNKQTEIHVNMKLMVLMKVLVNKRVEQWLFTSSWTFLEFLIMTDEDDKKVHGYFVRQSCLLSAYIHPKYKGFIDNR